MNGFEKRYFPLKREYRRRSANYRRCREIRAVRVRECGSMLTRLEIAFPAPRPENAGKKFCFISDWHWYGSERNLRLLAELEAMLARRKPDCLLLGGDMCEDACLLDRLPELLRRLSACAPVTLAVNGNWEAGKRWLPEGFFRRMYADCGITLLENSFFTAAGFRFLGLHDLSSLDFTALPAAEKEPEIARILLSHSPDGVMSADRDGLLDDFFLALCGHTHGGQVRLPLLGALYCSSFYRCKFDRGVFQREESGMTMIVSQGIGERRGCRRVLCPPEAVMLEFE